MFRASLRQARYCGTTHHKDAVYPATLVGIPPVEDFSIGGASVKFFLPIFKLNFSKIVDLAQSAEGV